MSILYTMKCPSCHAMFLYTPECGLVGFCPRCGESADDGEGAVCPVCNRHLNPLSYEFALQVESAMLAD